MDSVDDEFVSVYPDAERITDMIESHSRRPIARLVSYVVLARTLDHDGTLRANMLRPDDQTDEETQALLRDHHRVV